MMRRSPVFLRVLVLALVAVLALAACGGSESVGDQDLLEGTEGGPGGLRLGETTTTEAPEGGGETTTTAPANTTTTARPTAPTAPPQTQPEARPSAEVNIFPDSQPGGQIQPRVTQLFSGSIVRFNNMDSVSRSVEADNGAFSSGPIAPGSSWDWVAGAAGQYNYSDGTRPYAVASIEVFAS